MSRQNNGTQEKKKRKGLKILICILCVILAIIIIAAATVFVLIKIGENKMLDYDNVSIEMPDFAQTEDYGKVVYYNGEKYLLNENITSILGMGVDRTEFAEDAEVYGINGQADCIFLIALDTSTGKTKVIALSREMMADVDMYSAGGSLTGVKKRQLCLAYSYGDGRESSCENMVKSVQRVFYGLPVNSYFAINFSAMGAVNNSVGGVELESLEDMTMPSGRTIHKGEKITLADNEALAYCRDRSQVDIDANEARMDRQIQFVKAFVSKALLMTKSDITMPIGIYNTVSSEGDLITDINVSDISYLTTVALKNKSVGDIDFINIKGETVLGEDGHAQFTPNETEFFEMILNVFYNKA